jgi:hypothetical protein
MKASANSRTIHDDWYRHRQDHIPPGRSRRARGDCSAAEAAEMTGADAGLHADQARRLVRKTNRDLTAG